MVPTPACSRKKFPGAEKIHLRYGNRSYLMWTSNPRNSYEENKLAAEMEEELFRKLSSKGLKLTPTSQSIRTPEKQLSHTPTKQLSQTRAKRLFQQRQDFANAIRSRGRPSAPSSPNLQPAAISRASTTPPQPLQREFKIKGEAVRQIFLSDISSRPVQSPKSEEEPSLFVPEDRQPDQHPVNQSLHSPFTRHEEQPPPSNSNQPTPGESPSIPSSSFPAPGALPAFPDAKQSLHNPTPPTEEPAPTIPREPLPEERPISTSSFPPAGVLVASPSSDKFSAHNGVTEKETELRGQVADLQEVLAKQTRELDHLRELTIWKDREIAALKEQLAASQEDTRLMEDKYRAAIGIQT